MRHSSIVILALLLSAGPALRSQAENPQFRTHKSEDDVRRDNERMKEMNKERAQRIKRDTDKLLALATELKQYVDKTNENVLSVDVVKKAEEIEKLAKSVKERMKQDYRIPENVLP